MTRSLLRRGLESRENRPAFPQEKRTNIMHTFSPLLLAKFHERLTNDEPGIPCQSFAADPRLPSEAIL
jgi:hypothetical protein